MRGLTVTFKINAGAPVALLKSYNVFTQLTEN